MALASTPLGGPYSTASDAAAAVCGYDWDELPSDVRQKCMADQLRGFSRFRNTLTSSPLDVTIWTSSADGMLYATLVDNARADLREALAKSDGVGGDGGNFTNYNNNQNNPSGGTGTGTGGNAQQGEGTYTVVMHPVLTTRYASYGGTAYYTKGTDTNNHYFADNVIVTISGDAATQLSALDGYSVVLKLNYENYLTIEATQKETAYLYFGTSVYNAGDTQRQLASRVHISRESGFSYGGSHTLGTVTAMSENGVSITVNSSPLTFTTYTTAENRYEDISNTYVLAAVINADGTGDVGAPDSGGTGGGSGGDTYIYSPNTYNNNSNTTNVTNNTTNTTNNTTTTTINDTTNNTTYNYTTVVNGTNDIDMTPITARLDALNAMVGNLGIDVQSIGSDLRSLDSEVASFHVDFVRFGDWLYNLWQGLNLTLDKIIARLDLLDEDINALDVDAGTATSGTVDVDMTETNDLLQDIADKLDALNSLMAINTAANVLDAVLDLLDDLLDAIGGVLDTLADAFGELTDVFPFSIPWDLAIIGGLLVHEPVTPVLDISLPRMGAQPVVLHVDLTTWNDAAAIARGCELILFGVGLALNTREMMGIGDDVA